MPELVQRGAGGEYRIYAEIGAGGMASVHLARFLGTAGFARTVAIKRPLPNLQQNPDFRRLATREARLAARVQHPNVVPTLDVIDAGHELLIVMEYVHGATLSTLAGLARQRAERVPVEIAIALIGGVLRGLSAVHQARSERGDLLGLVHRDVSPQNILCGVDGVARLADFGLARASGDAGLSNSEDFKGKLTYAAPEQVELLPLTYAADLYAVGIVVWELLTGERRYRDRTAAELIAQLLHGKVVPPSQLVPSLPAALDAVVLRALARDPSQRHESALAMAAALEEAQRPASVEATAQWVSELASEALLARARLVTEAESETTPSQRQPVLPVDGLQPSVLAPAASSALPRDSVPVLASRGAGPLRNASVRLFAMAAGAGLVWLLGERLWPRTPPAPPAARPEESMNALSRPTSPVVSPPAAAPAVSSRVDTATLGEPASPARPSDALPRPATKAREGTLRGSSGAPGLDCSPPFSLDAEGIRHMKPGCK